MFTHDERKYIKEGHVSKFKKKNEQIYFLLAHQNLRSIKSQIRMRNSLWNRHCLYSTQTIVFHVTQQSNKLRSCLTTNQQNMDNQRTYRYTY